MGDVKSDVHTESKWSMSEFETDNYILQVAHRDGYQLGELARNMKDGRWLIKQNYCDTFENLMGKDAMLPTPISSNKKFHFFTLFMKLGNPHESLLDELSQKIFLYQLYGIQTAAFLSNIPFETEDITDLPFNCFIKTF